ncbi:MAG: NADPH-dependent F420 reductase [Actinobacteria bacterium]|nr:NADPH-dependent F420 reductase [Actinomycetota bacterium]
MRIGILGGTGPAGSALAARLGSVGFEVVVGSRSKYRALEAIDKIHEAWPGRKLPLTSGDNEAAAAADVVVIATPWDGATQTASSVAELLRGKVVISMANALTRIGKEFQPLVPPRGSVAASVQAAVPECLVAAAFHHVPAKELGDLDHAIETDVLVCSDHPRATEATAELVAKIPNMRPLDAGELSLATPIESFTAVLLQLNVRHRTRVALRFTGIGDHPTATPARPPAAAASDGSTAAVEAAAIEAATAEGASPGGRAGTRS